MENLVNNAKKFLETDQGKKIAESAGFGGNQNDNQGGNQGNNTNNNNNQGSTDAFGNPGQSGQFAQQGQYGAVSGQGFGGGLAKDRDGNPLQQDQGQGQGGGLGGASFDASGNQGQPGQYGAEGQWGAVRGKGLGGATGSPEKSKYEGMDNKDTTTSGDYGGDPFSRRAQMGADDEGKEPIAYDNDNDEGYKTGTSTPGYRHPDDVDALAAENRVKNQQNSNVYGQQSDERGSKDNDYHEQI